MKKFIYLLLLSTSIGVSAETITVSGTTVTKVFAGYSHKGIFFNISASETSDPAECGAGLPHTFFVDPDFSDVNHVLSVLLYAHASSKTVDVEFYDNQCTQNHRVIRKIAVN